MLKVPIQPRNFRSFPIFHVTKRGLKRSSDETTGIQLSGYATPKRYQSASVPLNTPPPSSFDLIEPGKSLTLPFHQPNPLQSVTGELSR